MIPGLRVSFAPSSLSIGGNPYASVDIIFTNNTSLVVYLSYVRLKRFTSLVAVPLDTSGSKDISSNAMDLTFFDLSRQIFHYRQVTLDTGSDAKVSIAVSTQLTKKFFYTHRVPRLRRTLGLRKYFVLEYTAMVGTRKYSVETVY